MSEKRSYSGLFGFLAFLAFLSFLAFVIYQMRQGTAQIVTKEDIERAREIARRLE